MEILGFWERERTQHLISSGRSGFPEYWQPLSWEALYLLSGFLLQTFFGNPIASPFVLGISSGAKLVVSLVMIFLLGKSMVASSAVLILAAFVGSMISMGFVLLVAKKVKQMSALIISGIMIGYICSAVTDL